MPTVIEPVRTADPGPAPAIRRDGRSSRSAWAAGLVVAGAGALLSGTGATILVRQHLLERQALSAESSMVGPALVAVVGALFLAERRWPVVRRPWTAPAHLVDLGYLALFAAIAPLVSFLDTGFALEIDRHAGFLVVGRLSPVPRLAVAAVILVGIDAMNWAAHVANHRRAALWRFHALHHSQEDMSVLTTFRTHPLAHVSYLPALLPALALQASGTVPTAALIAYGCLVTLPHANVGWTYGRLGGLLVSPASHRLHHAAGPVDGRPAVNFGFVLAVWDRLAGTAVRPEGRPAGATGLADRPVPVEQEASSGRAVWRVVGRQLGQPLRPDVRLERP